jgi:hypothetical protein
VLLKGRHGTATLCCNFDVINQLLTTNATVSAFPWVVVSVLSHGYPTGFEASLAAAVKLLSSLFICCLVMQSTSVERFGHQHVGPGQLKHPPSLVALHSALILLLPWLPTTCS